MNFKMYSEFLKEGFHGKLKWLLSVAYPFFKLMSKAAKSEDQGAILYFADGTFESNVVPAMLLASKHGDLIKDRRIVFGFENKGRHREAIESKLHAYPNISRWNLADHTGRSIYYSHSRAGNIIAYVTYVFTLAKLFFYQNIKYVVLANDMMFPSRFICLLAKSNNIKVVSLQHGTMNPCFFPIFADELYVYSELDKQYVNQNYPDELGKIKVLGFPTFDQFNQEYRKEKHKIVFLSQTVAYRDHYPNSITILNYAKMVLKVLRQYSDTVEIVIKLHPNETLDDLYRKLPDWREEYAKLVSRNTLEDELKTATIAIVINSTSMYTALLHQAKILQFVDKHEVHNIQYGYFLNAGLSESITIDNYEDKIKHLLEDAPANVAINFDQRHFLANWPHASEAIVDHIEKEWWCKRENSA